MKPFRPHMGPPDGMGWVATSDIVPFLHALHALHAVHSRCKVGIMTSFAEDVRLACAAPLDKEGSKSVAADWRRILSACLTTKKLGVKQWAAQAADSLGWGPPIKQGVGRSSALNVLTWTLVGMKLCMLHHSALILLSMTFPYYNTPCLISLEHNLRQELRLPNNNA